MADEALGAVGVKCFGSTAGNVILKKSFLIFESYFLQRFVQEFTNFELKTIHMAFPCNSPLKWVSSYSSNRNMNYL